jgi:CheY-like chemotaxis protein
MGIEEEMLPHLFNTFTQGEQPLARSRGGLGLGLAVAKGIVELHGGSISAHSEGIGKGAEFRLSVPLVGEPPALTERPPTVEPTSQAQRVLIVEDNRDAADSLGMMLELAGYTVEVAYAGLEGLEAAGRFRPEVALCDIGLPGGMDGYDLARALRGDERTAAIHLIAVSGYGQEEDQRRARAAGFDRHLTKPVDPALLLRTLEGLAGSTAV